VPFQAEYFFSAVWSGCAAENNRRMSSKNTWLWLTAAAALFAFIFLFEHFRPRPVIGPAYLLPGLDAKSVKSLQIRPPGQSEMRVERTNGDWQLVTPVVYPALKTNVQNLLAALQQLTVAHRISEKQFRQDPKAGENYGIEPPQLSLIIDSGRTVYFGHRTSPGDQVFVRVPGIDGIAIVSSDVLNLFPRGANDWRETRLADFKAGEFDRIGVTNMMKNQWSFALQRDSTNKLWTMTYPLRNTRADSEKVEDAIGRLEKLRVHQFISDNPKEDLEAFGLQPPVLTLSLGQGTNTLFALDFGKELTNSPGLIYARRRDQTAVVTIPTNTLAQWNTANDAFRDRHLVTLMGPIESIHVAGQDEFTLQWQTNNSWQIVTQGFPADERLATRLARTLSELQVANFAKDTVTGPQLPDYGLDAPVRKYTLTWTATPTATNPPTELDFGTTTNNQIFARRVGEDVVYGIAPADFEALPSASWELRDHHIWNFDITDVLRVVIQEKGKTREMLRNGTNGWSLPEGSTNMFVNFSAVEDTARELGHLTAFAWSGHGAAKLAGFGIVSGGYQLTIELKSGEKLSVQFGNATALGSVYASVMLNGEPWIFEFPPDVYPHVQYCLMLPPS
jgi:uncharacterized protein DUF4340